MIDEEEERLAATMQSLFERAHTFLAQYHAATNAWFDCGQPGGLLDELKAANGAIESLGRRLVDMGDGLDDEEITVGDARQIVVTIHQLGRLAIEWTERLETACRQAAKGTA
jgi:hypothetical protein